MSSTMRFALFPSLSTSQPTVFRSPEAERSSSYEGGIRSGSSDHPQMSNRRTTRTSMVRLLLDTGAAITTLSPEVLQDVGIPISSSSTASITTASRIERIPMATLPLVEFERKDLLVLCHSLPATARIDGLLGMNLFSGLHLSVQMKQGIFTLEDDR